MRADLDALPRDWISLPSARRVLTGAGISCEKIDVLEVYAGSARWTRACEAAMLRTVAAAPAPQAATAAQPAAAAASSSAVGGAAPQATTAAQWPSQPAAAAAAVAASHGVDILGGDQWDLTMEGARRLLWAVVVVCAPAWVHSGFPCTLWSTLAHITSKATIAEEEESRECALPHVILTCQLALWQHKKGYHVSFENPPSARSWTLDIVKNTVAAIGADTYKADSCAWGHVDPVSGKPVKKEQCVASTACLSSLRRRCTCYSGPGRCPSGIHQVVDGCFVMPLAVGDTFFVGGKRIKRSRWAGAYPEGFCRAWAQVVRASIAGM